MSLQTLPDIVLLGILQRIPSLESYIIPRLKEQIYLLGIFQRLRAIALPKIYANMYIVYSKHEKRKSKTFANKYIKSFANWIGTNADIIASANCTHMVKSVTLVVGLLGKKCLQLQRLFKALQACSSSWPSVTTLRISMNGDHPHVEPGLFHSTELHNFDRKYSRKLANIMPNITDLFVENYYDCCDVSEFCSQVTGIYANQLVKLTNEYCFDHTDGQGFEAMQYLCIHSGHYSSELPQINSLTLVELEINSLPSNVSWKPFMNNKHDKVIEFPCLKKLSLRFSESDYTIVSIPEYVLNFPELKSLTIQCDDYECQFIQISRFPSEMDYVDISAPSELLTELKEAGLPTGKIATKLS